MIVYNKHMMVQKVFWILFSFILVIGLSNQVSAHGNYIIDIDLDFDSELKSNVINSAQSYLLLDEEPIQFDFDRELINVKFDRRLEYSVAVNPLDNSVFGFRDDSLLTKGGVNYNLEQRKTIAEKVLDNLPEEYKSELVYGGEKKLYSGSFEYTWYRKVDNILVLAEHLKVEVDASDGDVIAWKLSIFSFSDTQISTTPAITHQVAQKIAELRFKAEPVDFNPVLIIDKNKPVWITKVKSLYPHFVAIDATNGNVLYSGSVKGELPENYDYGREIKVIETNLINQIYNN